MSHSAVRVISFVFIHAFCFQEHNKKRLIDTLCSFLETSFLMTLHVPTKIAYEVIAVFVRDWKGRQVPLHCISCALFCLEINGTLISVKYSQMSSNKCVFYKCPEHLMTSEN